MMVTLFQLLCFHPSWITSWKEKEISIIAQFSRWHWLYFSVLAHPTLFILFIPTFSCIPTHCKVYIAVCLYIMFDYNWHALPDPSLQSVQYWHLHANVFVISLGMAESMIKIKRWSSRFGSTCHAAMLNFFVMWLSIYILSTYYIHYGLLSHIKMFNSLILFLSDVYDAMLLLLTKKCE